MCRATVLILVVLMSSGVSVYPAGPCAAIAVMNVSAYDNTTGDVRYFGYTANGSVARSGTVAGGPAIPFGTRVFIPGYGLGTVQDRGGLITNQHLDIWFPRKTDALQWGRQRIPVFFVSQTP